MRPDDMSNAPFSHVAGRWRLGAPIGQGGHGSVWLAIDEDTGEEVAIKFVPLRSTGQAARLKREVTALRMLQTPGVVVLHGAGVESGLNYIVMERVKGQPFPGHARGWAEIQPLVISILETLRVIHAQGVVHRDLKPSNVLVTPEGRVVLLDFGIARGSLLGATITGSADILGTPAYLAPEQVERDAVVDGRADLYALGVMLYETLAGRLPFEGYTLHELLVARLGQEPPPLIRADIPPSVSHLIGHLLARHPKDRVSSAEEALSHLGVGTAAQPMPWLGGRGAIMQLEACLKQGRSCELWGPVGSGKTRVVHAVIEALTLAGLTVFSLPAGLRPLESLAPVLEGVGLSGLQAAESHLRGLLRAGTVIVADDAEGLDRWSRGLLERLRLEGAVFRVQASPDAVVLSEFSEVELRDIFHGPDQVLHLKEDSARILHQRTGGLVGQIVEELKAWVISGKARWEDGRLRMDRRAVEYFAAYPPLPRRGRINTKLDASADDLLGWMVLAGTSATVNMLATVTERPDWEVEMEVSAMVDLGAVRFLPDGQLQAMCVPHSLSRWSDAQRSDAHRTLAQVTARTSLNRTLHLLAAGDTVHVPDAAVAFAQAALQAGGAGQALAVLHLTLEEDCEKVRLLETLAQAALVDGSVRALVEARRKAEREGAGALADLLAGWEAAAGRRYGEAEAKISGLAPFENPELEAWRVGLPVRIAVTMDLKRAELQLEGLKVDPDSPVGHRKLEWWGHLRYRQHRFLEAAVLHAEAAQRPVGVVRRCNALVNAGLAWRDGYEFDAALAAFNQAVLLASEARLCLLEGHARVGLRSVLYRQARLDAVDIELLEAVETLGQPALLSVAFLNEAAVAWRQQQLVLAEDLAQQAALLWDTPGTRASWLFATALACAAGGHAREAALLLPEVLAMPVNGLSWQVAALIALAGVNVVMGGERPKPPFYREAVLDMREVLDILWPDGG